MVYGRDFSNYPVEMMIDALSVLTENPAVKPNEPAAGSRQFRGSALIASLVLIFSLVATPSAQAKSTFYLDMTLGCYAGNKKATKYLKWSGPNYKQLYATTCTKPFHYQVYHLGALKGSLKGQSAQAEAQQMCIDALDPFVSRIRNSKSAGIGWFFPDLGKEESRYGKRLICFLRMVSDATYDISVRQTQPIIEDSANTI